MKMEMEWNRIEVSFQEHSKSVTEFRRSNSVVALINGPRCSERNIWKRTAHLQFSRTMLETGGSRFLNGIKGWSNLVPVPGVAQYKLLPN